MRKVGSDQADAEASAAYQLVSQPDMLHCIEHVTSKASRRQQTDLPDVGEIATDGNISVLPVPLA